MSAIAGIFDREERYTPDFLERMMRMMAHRTGGKYHLFRTRMVEIAGRVDSEELAFKRHKVIVALDGELHHPEELKKKLKERGYAAQDSSAEGLLALAYLEWGQECFKQIQGDFICAVFDIAKSTLLLARGLLAKRPLFWFQAQERFFFASELKALLATRCIPNHLCVEGLSIYCALGYYPLEITPIRGVHKLLPGYFLKIGLEFSPATHYYGPDLQTWEMEKSLIKQTPSISELLRANFEKQQAACHSVGCILSGGLGSAALAYLLATSRSDQRIHTWVVGWEGGVSSQTTIQLQQVAHDLMIPFDIVVMQPSAMLQEMLSMVWYLDEPVINMEVWTMWKVARMGFASIQALYSAFGLDHALPFVFKRQQFLNSRLGWLYSLYNQQARFKGYLDPFLQLMPQKMRLKWARLSLENPLAFKLLYSIWWTSYALFQKAAPQLLREFDAGLFIEQVGCTKGVTMFFSPYMHLFCTTQVFAGMTQPAEKIAGAFGLSAQTPYMEYNMLLTLNKIFSTDFSGLIEQLNQILRPVLSAEKLQGLKLASRVKLPPWSDHPAFIQAFEMLEQGVLVRSGWVLRSWLLSTIKHPQRRKAAFGFLLAILQWEMWYKMFIEQPPHEHPPPLSVTQFLHG